jgi:hypothetical protein
MFVSGFNGSLVLAKAESEEESLGRRIVLLV